MNKKPKKNLFWGFYDHPMFGERKLHTLVRADEYDGDVDLDDPASIEEFSKSFHGDLYRVTFRKVTRRKK